MSSDTCNGTTTDGDPCQLPAGWGTDSTDYCLYHVPMPAFTLPQFDSLAQADDSDLIIVNDTVHARRDDGTYVALTEVTTDGDGGGTDDSTDGSTDDGSTDDGSTDDGDSTDESDDTTTEWPQTLTIEADAGASWESYAFHVDGDVEAKDGIDSGDDISPQGDGTTKVEGGIKDGKVESYTVYGPLLSQSLASSQTLTLSGSSDTDGSTDGSDTTDGSDSTDGTTTPAGDAKTHITFDDDTWRSQFTGIKDDLNDTVASPSRSGDALRVQIPEGEHAGANMHFEFADNWGSRPDEVHVRYWLRLGDGWGMGSHDKSWDTNGGKLPGFADLTYGSAHGGGSVEDSWSARGTFRPPESGGDSRLGWYNYLPGKDGGYGSSADWNTNGEVDFGEWIQIDQYVRVNDVGESNGVLRAWVDGVLAHEDTSVRFRTQDTVHIGEWWLDVYMGGGWTAGRDMALYIDDVQMFESEQSP